MSHLTSDSSLIRRVMNAFAPFRMDSQRDNVAATIDHPEHGRVVPIFYSCEACNQYIDRHMIPADYRPDELSGNADRRNLRRQCYGIVGFQIGSRHITHIDATGFEFIE